MPRFQDKVVIVTGSSSGIGAATALLFAKEGAYVTITGRNEEKLKQTLASIVDSGVAANRVHTVVGDLTEEETQKRIVEGTVAKWGKLDVLVNNAGASISEGKRGFDVSDEGFRRTMEVNLHSVVQLVRLARPHLIRSKGEIVNVSSIAGLNFAVCDAPFYAMSKAALDQFTRALAIDLISHEVRVNGVSPGIVETDFIMNTGLTKEQSDKCYKFYGSQRAAVPRGSNASPDEIANVIAFLADRGSSSYIVGQMIVADGGTSLLLGAYTFDFEKVLSS